MCATTIADRLRDAGFEMLNDVVHQPGARTMVDGPATTERLIARIQDRRT